MASSARSLADDLRRRDDDELATLLLRRPDLARPAPADVTTLAARATTRASIQRALEQLDLARLQALEVVVVAGPAPADRLARLLGEPARSGTVAALLADLGALALVWCSPDGYRVPRAVQEVVTTPAGLGPAVPGTPDGAELDALLAGIESSERAVLDALAWGPARGALAEGGSGDRTVGRAGRALVERGLLHRLDDRHVVLPRQVALALRGGRVHRQPALRPPAYAGRVLDGDVVDAAAGGRAGELLTLTAELLDEWGARPPRVLRAGGLAVRDLARVADLLECSAAEAAWLVEVAHAAGLVAADDSADPHWMPTGESDDWAEQPPARRWARLARAWLTTSAAPSLVGSEGGSRVNALSVQTSWPAGRQRRLDTLRALVALPAGAAPTTGELQELLRWRHPVRSLHSEEAELQVVVRESEWAGVTGRGALARAGRLLLEDDEAGAVDAAAAHIPDSVEHVLLQADLTAVAPGRLDGPARGLMRLVADVESRGGATVHRLTERTVRRALDTGWSADRLLHELAQVSRTGIPQPLEYLVRDVARRHGVARVGSATSYVRSDDGALLDRMLADRGLGMLQLRRIAPTVLVSPVPATTVLDVLRELQYGPVAEGPDGGVALGPSHDHRTSRRGTTTVRVSTVDRAVAEQVVALMRQGEQARTAVVGRGEGAPPATDPAVTAGLLREAAAEGAPVWVGYADEAGGVQTLLLRPVAVEAGRVRGTIADQDAARTLLLHRISGVRPAE